MSEVTNIRQATTVAEEPICDLNDLPIFNKNTFITVEEDCWSQELQRSHSWTSGMTYFHIEPVEVHELISFSCRNSDIDVVEQPVNEVVVGSLQSGSRGEDSGITRRRNENHILPRGKCPFCSSEHHRVIRPARRVRQFLHSQFQEILQMPNAVDRGNALKRFAMKSGLACHMVRLAFKEGNPKLLEQGVELRPRAAGVLEEPSLPGLI